ncbi:MAG: hypothetical protein GVY11_07505 [Gammaproteobacteria bacterium]|jgi:hypothetical protein|nr:hypothetical protein [Gammaproteobacteria bacterium]
MSSPRSSIPELISRLVGILLLRDGPQDLPAGSNALALAIGLYTLASGASLMAGEQPPGNPIGILLLAILLPMVLTRIVLSLRGRPARWIQTLTALFGTSALISLVSLPLSLGGGEPSQPLIVASLVLFIWSFAVDAHIWRHALDTIYPVGLAVAVLLFALSMFVITSLAGPL